MVRTYRYPLHPTPAQASVLVSWLATCCTLYNAALQERREGWRRGKTISVYDQKRSLTEVRADDPVMAAMPVEVQRSALARLDGAFKAFFRRCRAGQTPGYPRFRARRRYDSFSYPASLGLVAGAGRSGRIAVPKLGLVKVHLYRPLRGKPLHVTIRREATGRWWACVACDLGAAPPVIDRAAVAPERAVGVDVGLRALAALSTGKVIENPRHAAQAAAVLARRQRSVARKRKGSASRKRAGRLVAKAYAHVRNQRLDHARKVACSLVQRFDLIAHEDLNIAGMSRGMLAGSINSAAWRVLLHAVACKAEEAGKAVVSVDPRGTSQACSGCGAVVPKDLSVRVHRCPPCGLTLDRDVNAARNILARACAPGTGAVSGAPQKRGTKARRKTVSQEARP